MKRIILASASPRRKELLEQIGLSFEIIPSKGEEIITKQEPGEVVKELSFQKAEAVAKEMTGDAIVIGSDTIVWSNGEILGKPHDKEDAKRMIRGIQGSIHSVFTGVTVISKEDGQYTTDTIACETKVSVYPMSEQEIDNYIATGEPMDKAGAYGIQGYFGAYIEGIEGDYHSVVGLPIGALWQILKKYMR